MAVMAVGRNRPNSPWNASSGRVLLAGAVFGGNSRPNRIRLAVVTKQPIYVYRSHMRSISLHSVRDRATVGMLAALMLAFGSSGAGAQEAKPAPTPAPADAKPAPTPAPADAKPGAAPAPADAKDKDKDKEKAGDKEAPLPADAHVAQSIQLDGKPLHYTVTVGTLPVYDAGKKTGEVVCTAYTVEGQDRPVTFALNGGPGAASVFLNFAPSDPSASSSAWRETARRIRRS